MGEPLLEIRGVGKTYRMDKRELPVLRDITLRAEAGDFIIVIGHSGCGKSTMLRLIAGLEPCERGEILLQGRPVKGPDPVCGMVFQDNRLLPWLRVRDNVGFGLSGRPRRERERIVEEHLALVGLNAFADAYPAQLSGGMAQRVAIARGLAANPRLLLLDEPFGALDALTRIQLQREVRRIWLEQGTTMILVTHDIDEAVYLGQRVAVLTGRPGEIRATVPIELEGERDRGSGGFLKYKQLFMNLLL